MTDDFEKQVDQMIKSLDSVLKLVESDQMKMLRESVQSHLISKSLLKMFMRW